ncbi:hypothetical protein D3C87_1616170 [compost metagenome]
MAQSRVHDHHPLDGVDQLMGFVGVRFDQPVFRVIRRAAAYLAGALVDLSEKFFQRFDDDALFAIVSSRIARDRQTSENLG